ncbi:hypothetical protein B0O80DRAFT_31761 [Mortierella sp. GBAus27b]|nr:hypothetical protein B0O80DRAFT_31761 [Mortierella sp. GBAus27b]
MTMEGIGRKGLVILLCLVSYVFSLVTIAKTRARAARQLPLLPHTPHSVCALLLTPVPHSSSCPLSDRPIAHKYLSSYYGSDLLHAGIGVDEGSCMCLGTFKVVDGVTLSWSGREVQQNRNRRFFSNLPHAIRGPTAKNSGKTGFSERWDEKRGDRDHGCAMCARARSAQQEQGTDKGRSKRSCAHILSKKCSWASTFSSAPLSTRTPQ